MVTIPGTKYYIETQINQSMVYSVENYYLYCLPLKLITDDRFWNEITTSSNIGVVDATYGVQAYKSTLGFIDNINKSGVLYWCGNTYSSAKFNICVGSTINVLDSNVTFLEPELAELFPLCENTGSTIVTGISTYFDIIDTSHAGAPGYLYKCIRNENSASGGLIRSGSVSFPVSDYTYSFIIKVDSGAASGYYLYRAPGDCSIYYEKSTKRILIWRSATAASATNALDIDGNYHLITIQSCSDGKINFFIDGEQSGLSDQYIEPTSIQIDPYIAGPGPSALVGNIEQFKIVKSILLEGVIKTDYNMFFNAQYFFGNDFNVKVAPSTYNKNRVNLRLGIGI